MIVAVGRIVTIVSFSARSTIVVWVVVGWNITVGSIAVRIAVAILVSISIVVPIAIIAVTIIFISIGYIQTWYGMLAVGYGTGYIIVIVTITSSASSAATSF